MAVFLSPYKGPFFVPGGAVPASGGKVFTYNAGTTTKQTSYTTNSTSSAWANPLILDSGGNFGGSNEMWLTGGSPYKIVVAPSNDTDPPGSPYFQFDNVSGINDVTTSSSGEWVVFNASTPVFSSAGSFVVSGDQTATFTVGRRTKTTNSGGTVFSTITSSVFAASTTVGVANDSPGVLDAGLSAVSYGVLSTPNGSVPWMNATALGMSTTAFSTNSLTANSSVVASIAISSSSPVIFGLVAKRKPSDDKVFSSTVFHNDNDLFFSIRANEEWVAVFDLSADTQNTSGIKFSVAAPTGASGSVQGTMVGSTAGDTLNIRTTPNASMNLSPTNTGTDSIRVLSQIVNSTNAGTVNLQWAQQAATAFSTTVHQGSIMTAYRLV